MDDASGVQVLKQLGLAWLLDSWIAGWLAYLALHKGALNQCRLVRKALPLFADAPLLQALHLRKKHQKKCP